MREANELWGHAVKRFLQAAGAALVLGVFAAPAQAVVIGSADSSNSIPFGSTLGGYYYQQIYSAASFASAISISEISFYNSVTPGGAPRAGDFRVYLSTTSADIATFDTNTALPWYDASFTEVFSGALPALAGGRLDLTLSASFNYDPSMGSLLLTVREFTLGGGPGLFLDVYQNDGVTNSRFSAYPYDWNQGLVTGFNATIGGAVPEPATWAMMLIGFAGLGFAARRKALAAV